MQGLIPFMLKPVQTGNSNRQSVSFAPPPQHTRHQSSQLPLPTQSSHFHMHHPRSSSLSAASTTTYSTPSLQVPSKPKPVRRFSSAAPPALTVLPYKAADWARVIAELKRQHTNRRYRACYTRCNEILNNIKDTANVEPAYLISLHFYAATSLEMSALPLLAPSPYRDSLLQQARDHYSKADALITKAEDAVFSKSRPSSFISVTSSAHSPYGSISSPAFTAATSVSSRSPSICSSEDFTSRSETSRSDCSSSPPLPARKTVSFDLPKEEEEPLKLEPFIRPDSPTLGFEDEYYTSAMHRELPAIPQPPPPQKVPEAIRLIEDDDMTPRTLSDDPFRLSQYSFDARRDPIRDSFLSGTSTARYCMHLAGLKSQLTLHKANLESIIETPTQRERFVNSRPPTPIDEEQRLLDRKARIERLRKNGWQRKRFDVGRYEALRAAALADLE